MSIREDSFNTQTIQLPPIQTRSPNRLLASLPLEDYARLAPHLRRVPMRAKHLLYKQDALIEGVYFPGGGACALVKTTEDGRSAQIADVGCEGAIGVSAFFGLNRHPADAIVNVAGPGADFLPMGIFMSEMERRGALHNRVVRYNQALMMQLMQSTACNGLHSATQRFARWLLTVHDRAGRDEFSFTHDQVSTMLGLRRPTVTLIAGSLRAAGLIECHRGKVRVADRAGLEAASCRCYHEVRGTFRRLLPEMSSTPMH